MPEIRVPALETESVRVQKDLIEAAHCYLMCSQLSDKVRQECADNLRQKLEAVEQALNKADTTPQEADNGLD